MVFKFERASRGQLRGPRMVTLEPRPVVEYLVQIVCTETIAAILSSKQLTNI